MATQTFTATVMNVALSANGGVATSSSNFNVSPYHFTAAGANDGDRKGANWGSGSGFPGWLEIDFNGNKSIGEIDVFTVQDNYSSPSEPTETMTFGNYGLTGYEVQYWNGSAWADVSGGSVGGNNKVWPEKFTPINVQLYDLPRGSRRRPVEPSGMRSRYGTCNSRSI